MEDTNLTPEVTDTLNTTPEAVEPIQEPAPKPKKKRVRQEVRPLAELDTASIRSMNDSEKNKYIEALRELSNDLTLKNAQLEQNCKSAYDKCRLMEQRFADFKNIARAKLQFAKQAIATCHNSIILAGNIEEE